MALLDALPTGLQHGTVTVPTAGGNVEVTTYRVDGAYGDGRHPDCVTFTRTLSEDLLRRDFTVNAMALSRQGELVDPTGGRRDLTAGLLRCVGEPDVRFAEDALRILRGLRFAATLGFSIQSATAESLHRNRELLKKIAAERIAAELTRLICGENMGAVLRDFPDVLGVFLPDILPMVGFDQRNRHHCYDIWAHTIYAMEQIAPTPILRYTMLFHDIGKPRCFELDDRGSGHFCGHPRVSVSLAAAAMDGLKFDTATRETVLRLVDWHDRDIPRTEKSIGRALMKLGETDLRRLLAVKRADNLAQHPDFWGRQAEIDRAEEIMNTLLEKKACFSLGQLAVNGRDLLAEGMVGPAIGEMLDFLLLQVIDGALPNEKAALLDAVHLKNQSL